jgi:hypothetical protein
MALDDAGAVLRLGRTQCLRPTRNPAGLPQANSVMPVPRDFADRRRARASPHRTCRVRLCPRTSQHVVSRSAVIDTDRASGATRRVPSPMGLERPASLRWQGARLGLAAAGIDLSDREPRRGRFIKRNSIPDCRQASGPTCGPFPCDIVNSCLSAIAARWSRVSRTFLC